MSDMIGSSAGSLLAPAILPASGSSSRHDSRTIRTSTATITSSPSSISIR
jgi:hypothetical protein